MSSSVIPILNATSHTMAQMIAALGTGAAIDYAFWRLTARSGAPAAVRNAKEAIVEALEVSGQMVVGGLVLASVFAYLTSLSLESADPAQGAVFLSLFFGVAQPVLNAKVKRVMHYIRTEIVSSVEEADTVFFGNSRASRGVSLSGVDASAASLARHNARNGIVTSGSAVGTRTTASKRSTPGLPSAAK